MIQLIRTAADLPPPRSSHEMARMEFKRDVATTDRVELAKDVAAFANSVGGTILVGAVPNGETLAIYKPMTKEQSAKAMRDYDEAVRDLCAPKPLVETHEIPKDDGFVLAVNVWAFPGQPVGVLVGEKSAGTYRFPLRSGAQTVNLAPDQLPMMMLPEVRRVAILLSQIPKEDRGSVKLICEPPDPEKASPFRPDVKLDLNLEEVVMRNTVRFVQKGADRKLVIPADSIAHVWQSSSASGPWTITARVSVRDRENAWEVTPWG
jgi:hypothetical protein